MGIILSKITKLPFQIFNNPRKTALLMVGLDAAGKTTLLYKLKLGEIVTTIPTIGFNVETLRYKNTEINVWDVGGCDKIRPLWEHYYKNVNGLIFVIDSNDPERAIEAHEELHQMLREEMLQDIPVLVFANKQDLPNAMSVSEITGHLGLYRVTGRDWHVEPICATSGEGIKEGLQWLDNTIHPPPIAEKPSPSKREHKA